MEFSVPLRHLKDRNLIFLIHCCVRESEIRLVVSNSLRPHGLYSSWNSPGQNTGVSSLSLLQEIFPTQGLNPGLPHCKQILYQLSHMPGSSPGGSRVIRRWGRSRCPWKKYIFNYRYIERLETDSVVGRLVEKKRLNNLVYVEIASMLQMGIQPEKLGARKKWHGGISLSRNWSQFLYF